MVAPAAASGVFSAQVAAYCPPNTTRLSAKQRRGSHVVTAPRRQYRSHRLTAAPTATTATPTTATSVSHHRSRQPEHRRTVCAASSSSGGRKSIKELKEELRASGVDTSTMFERAEFEAKLAELYASGYTGATNGQQQQQQQQQQQNSSNRSGSSGNSSSSSSSGGAGWQDNPKVKDAQAWASKQMGSLGERGVRVMQQQGAKLSAFTQQKFKGAIEYYEKMDRRFAISGTARQLGQQYRNKAVTFLIDVDEKLGVVKFFRTNGPPLIDKFNKLRDTPLGSLATTFFFLWLFLSGTFFTLFFWAMPISFVINWLFPGAMANWIAKRQGLGGGMGPGGPGGFGGGAGGAGGQQQQRRQYRNEGSGDVIDIDADVK